jgi:ribose transport system substrate-binding protein
MREPYLIKSVAHSALLMAAFEMPGEVLTQRELVQRTGLSRGIVLRLLYTLERHGVVEKLGQNQFRLLYWRSGKRKWKIGYGAPGIETLFTRQVTDSVRIAAERCGDVELMILDHRYKPNVTLRNVEQFVRERVDLVIEYQIDEHLGAMMANQYREAHIPVIAVNNPQPGATYFGANNLEAGLIGGRYLAKWAKTEWAGEVDEIVMVELARAGTIPKMRLVGMVQALRETLGFDPARVPVVYLDGNGQLEASWEVIRKHLRRSSGKRTLVGAMNDNSALGILRAYEEMGSLSLCAVVGQNGSAEARHEMRRRGTRLIASVAYFPETYGEGLIDLARCILNRQFVPPAVFTKHQLLTPKNVDEVYPNDALFGLAEV